MKQHVDIQALKAALCLPKDEQAGTREILSAVAKMRQPPRATLRDDAPAWVSFRFRKSAKRCPFEVVIAAGGGEVKSASVGFAMMRAEVAGKVDGGKLTIAHKGRRYGFALVGAAWVFIGRAA